MDSSEGIRVNKKQPCRKSYLFNSLTCPGARLDPLSELSAAVWTNLRLIKAVCGLNFPGRCKTCYFFLDVIVTIRYKKEVVLKSDTVTFRKLEKTWFEHSKVRRNC
jgi:hypothetical protein